jgi:hypothetical protein
MSGVSASRPIRVSQPIFLNSGGTVVQLSPFFPILRCTGSLSRSLNLCLVRRWQSTAESEPAATQGIQATFRRTACSRFGDNPATTPFPPAASAFLSLRLPLPHGEC